MSPSGVEDQEARAVFNMSLGELGPKLHGYCARMTGAVSMAISTDGCFGSHTMRRSISCAVS
jgi:hypothetical protein